MKSEAINILLIEDNPDDARLVKEFLSESKQASSHMDIADRLSQGMDRAKNNHYDAVLLDLGLPDSKGLNTFIKLHTAFNHLPIVVLSGLDDESVALKAVQEGAQDYLIKGKFDRHILWRSIRYAIERKRAEVMLRKSEEKYHTIADFTRDWEYWLSPEGSFVYVSPSCKFHTGYDSEAFQQDPDLMLKIMHPDDRDIYARHQKEALATDQRSKPLDFRIITLDGVERWIGHRCQKVYSPDGEYLGTRGSNRDITDRKVAEQAVLERLKELTSLYGITSLAEIRDISLDDLLKRIVALIPPGYQFPEITAACIVLEGQAFQTARFRETPWMQAGKIKVDGKTVGHVKVCYLEERPASDDGPFLKEERQLIDDIALRIGKIVSRMWSEEALRESEAQYRLLSEHMTDTVWLMDMQLKTTYQSPSAAKLRGLTPQEILELPLEKHATPESLKLAFEVLSEEMPRVKADPDYNPIRTLELEYYRKDGTTVWTENKFSVIRDENCKPVSIMAEARDITDRKLAEEKLLKSYESVAKTLNDAINTMVKIVELRDPYTAGHQQKVADLATAIAGEMKLEDARIDQLRTAALIHDIGKMYVPSDILSKPGKLADMEFNLIKTHAQSGYDIVKGMDFPGVVAEAILQHHERMDGSGYPNGLKGEDTLIEAKILAVADVIEAMSSHRPYRPALGVDKALEEISNNKGKLYDPAVVDICLELFNSGRFEFK